MSAPLRQTHGRAKSSSRNVRHKQPVGHALLEMPDHRALGGGSRDRQRLARRGPELDNIGAVILRPVDHPVLARQSFLFAPFFSGLAFYGLSCI
jgi:hypothetical protein